MNISGISAGDPAFGSTPTTGSNELTHASVFGA